MAVKQHSSRGREARSRAIKVQERAFPDLAQTSGQAVAGNIIIWYLLLDLLSAQFNLLWLS